jgi:hypothetical protein
MSIEIFKKRLDFLVKVYYNTLVNEKRHGLQVITNKRNDSFLCNM